MKLFDGQLAGNGNGTQRMNKISKLFSLVGRVILEIEVVFGILGSQLAGIKLMAPSE